MDLHELLFDSSRKTADMAAKVIGDDPVRFTKLLEVALQDKDLFSMRAARATYLCCRQYPSLILPHRSRIIQQLSGMKIDGLKREMTRLLSEQAFDYEEEEAGLLVETCFNWMGDHSEKVSVRIYAMDILYKASERYPELIPELVSTIEQEIPRSSSAHAVRGKRMLSRLRQDLKNKSN